MRKIFKATEPGRYCLHVNKEGVQSITGYKIVIDMESGVYDAFIQEEGTWLPLTRGKKVSSRKDLWIEIAEGHLIEVTE